MMLRDHSEHQKVAFAVPFVPIRRLYRSSGVALFIPQTTKLSSPAPWDLLSADLYKRSRTDRGKKRRAQYTWTQVVLNYRSLMSPHTHNRCPVLLPKYLIYL